MIFSATTLFSNSIPTKVIDVLLVAGGGGGGAITGSRGLRTFTAAAGGGGAGGYISTQLEISSASVLSITIGNGGTGGCLDSAGQPCGFAINGQDSIMSISSSLYNISFTAIGGGAGGNYSTITDSYTKGQTGGSGGGNSGIPIAFQGFEGGNSGSLGSGGGGGASQAGYSRGSNNISGGDGKQWYDGNYYAGGGGAGGETNPTLPNTGGLGGGGRGGFRQSGFPVYLPNGTNGTANTGGGGGGKGSQQDTTGAGTFTGGTGGSGIAKIRYYGTGSIFTAGSSSFNSGDGYTYYTFTSSVAFSGSF